MARADDADLRTAIAKSGLGIEVVQTHDPDDPFGLEDSVIERLKAIEKLRQAGLPPTF